MFGYVNVRNLSGAGDKHTKPRGGGGGDVIEVRNMCISGPAIRTDVFQKNFINKQY